MVVFTVNIVLGGFPISFSGNGELVEIKPYQGLIKVSSFASLLGLLAKIKV